MWKMGIERAAILSICFGHEVGLGRNNRKNYINETRTSCVTTLVRMAASHSPISDAAIHSGANETATQRFSNQIINQTRIHLHCAVSTRKKRCPDGR